jgi:hypothetical protein
MMRPASARDDTIPDRTATLRLRVDQLFTTPETAQMGYVARVRDVTPGRPQAERDSVSELVIPVGGGGFRELSVRPGDYLIEAVTPAGAVLEADVTVADGESQAVSLADDTPSPHEWLGWQKVSGNLPGYAAEAVATVRRPPRGLWLAIGGGVLALLLVLAAAAYFTLRSTSASYESVNASAEVAEAASEEGAAGAAVGRDTPTAAEPPSETPVAETAIKRDGLVKPLPPIGRPKIPPDRTFARPGGGSNEYRQVIRRPAGAPETDLEVPPPPPEARGSGAPAPVPAGADPPATAAPPATTAPPATAPPTTAPRAAKPPAAAPRIDGLDDSAGLPNWFWLVGLGLLATGGGAAELARRGKLPGLGRPATQAAEPPSAGDIFKSAPPPDVPLAPAPTARSMAPPTAAAEPATPARMTLLTLPTGSGEWATLLAALDGRAALSEAYALAGAAADRRPEPQGRDEVRTTYAVLPLPGADGGRPLWAVDSPPAGRAEAVRLPERWMVPESEQTVAIEIMTAAEGREERISTAVRDPHYGTLLGYLAGGRLPEARALLDHAAEALFGKTLNPYLAAAGGYVLIGSATTYDDAPWRGWLHNLDSLHPWLPDAAVLQAVSMAQTRQEGVRAKALEAMDRGVPVYTEGLKRLRDVLTLLVEQPDPDGRVAQSLDAVSRLAGRCNPQQVFTSLRLGA